MSTRRLTCTHCGQPVFRFVTGNLVDWSHNPAKIGAVPCQK
jgi:hypothetical protein